MKFLTLEHILIHISFSAVSIGITIHLLSLLVDEFVELYDSSEKGRITCFFCITGLLVTRWIYSGHLPLSNLYESLIFLSWILSIIHMVPYFKNKNYLSPIMSPSTFFIQGFATSGLLTNMHQSSTLAPALQSQWLMMHVSMMVLGYAALLCGSLLSVALLKRGKLDSFSIRGTQATTKKRDVLRNISFCFLSCRNYYKVQLIQQLDHWGFRIIGFGFFFLTIGILSGAVWANEAWGSYWSWDPKETWAFITWIIFAIYFHIRVNKNGEGLNPAMVASLGFFLIWTCYFGVNLLGIGLHSYGSFTLTSN
ncbi:Cytochrome c biogenesis protein CcsA [Linum perenne]